MSAPGTASKEQLLLGLVYLPLQHVLDLLGREVVKVVDPELLAGLLPGDELALDSQPSVSNLLPAVVADLLLPNPLLPEWLKGYFFSRYLSSLTLRH